MHPVISIDLANYVGHYTPSLERDAFENRLNAFRRDQLKVESVRKLDSEGRRIRPGYTEVSVIAMYL